MLPLVEKAVAAVNAAVGNAVGFKGEGKPEKVLPVMPKCYGRVFIIHSKNPFLKRRCFI